MKKKLLVPLILFLSITIAFLVQLKRNAQGEDIKALESALVGKPVPAKNLTELFENKAYTNELFQQGKPVLLNVWATWCPTCYAEHQYLNKLAKDGVRIIGLDYKDESPKAMKWLKDLGNPYQVVLKDEKVLLRLRNYTYDSIDEYIKKIGEIENELLFKNRT